LTLQKVIGCGLSRNGKMVCVNLNGKTIQGFFKFRTSMAVYGTGSTTTGQMDSRETLRVVQCATGDETGQKNALIKKLQHGAIRSKMLASQEGEK